MLLIGYRCMPNSFLRKKRSSNLLILKRSLVCALNWQSPFCCPQEEGRNSLIILSICQ